jgi:transforming growth factor-beta-induced protein
MKQSRLMLWVATMSLTCAALAGPAAAGTAKTPSTKDATAAAAKAKVTDIVSTAVAAGNFKTLAAALQAAGLVETLQGKGPFTVFAPTDAAFAKLPAGTIEELLKPENKQKLTSILTYHVVAGKVMAKEVVGMTSAKTVNGQSLTVVAKDGKVSIDGATVVKADIDCSNGVIHVIDSVVLPK